jgi:hypothetical protein
LTVFLRENVDKKKNKNILELFQAKLSPKTIKKEIP